MRSNRLTPAEARQLLERLQGKKAANKYRARGTWYRGVRYHSAAEAARASELDLLLDAGALLDWIRQPILRLGVPENRYVPDFLVIPVAGVPWYEDVKGARTRKFDRDVKLWKAYGRLELHVITKTGTEVVPGGRQRSAA